MIQRFHSNHITHITSAQGNKLISHNDIEHELTSFFLDLLSGYYPERMDVIHSITQKIPNLVSEEQNSNLMRPITLEEVEDSNFSLAPGKALRHDGFTSYFFHHCWQVINFYVCIVYSLSELVT
jgi:hypothetical protein